MSVSGTTQSPQSPASESSCGGEAAAKAKCEIVANRSFDDRSAQQALILRYKSMIQGRNFQRQSVYFRGAGQQTKDSTYDLTGIGEQPTPLNEQRLGVLQIGAVETFGEPVVDIGEHPTRGLVQASLLAFA